MGDPRYLRGIVSRSDGFPLWGPGGGRIDRHGWDVMDLLELQNAVDENHSIDVLGVAADLLGPPGLYRTGLEGHESYVAPSIELFATMRVASDDGFVEAERDVRSVDGSRWCGCLLGEIQARILG